MAKIKTVTCPGAVLPQDKGISYGAMTRADGLLPVGSWHHHCHHFFRPVAAVTSSNFRAE